MSNSIYNKIVSVYRNASYGFATKSSSLRDLGVANELAAAVFVPGDYFYAVFNWTSMDIEMVSENVAELFNVQPKEFDTDFLVSRYHPEDMPAFVKKEKKVIEFLFNFIKKDDLAHYKVSHCFRMKTGDGQYRLFLSQSLTIGVDENFKIAKTFNVFSDISFITKVNNNRISFIGINGRPSYANIDPRLDAFPIHNSYNLSPRELEVVQLIAEGHPNKSIADYLNISPDTVRTHRNNILRKTELKTTTQLVATLIREGLV